MGGFRLVTLGDAPYKIKTDNRSSVKMLSLNTLAVSSSKLEQPRVNYAV
jgi:hypothetical protein